MLRKLTYNQNKNFLFYQLYKIKITPISYTNRLSRLLEDVYPTQSDILDRLQASVSPERKSFRDLMTVVGRELFSGSPGLERPWSGPGVITADNR